MGTHAEIDIHTANDAADLIVCHQVNEILQKHYPNHLWAVGCNHEAGTVHVELPYQTRIQTRFPFGFLLHVSSMKNADEMEKKVMLAGGELLERYKLKRGAATSQTRLLAKENGLNTDGALR